MAVQIPKTNTVEEISPLCIRIKNAFSKDEISLIHQCHQHAIKPKIEITPGSKVRASINHKYIDCIAMGSCTIYKDNIKNEDEKEELVQVKICESQYTKKHGISNTICFLPIDRLDQDDLIDRFNQKLEKKNEKIAEMKKKKAEVQRMSLADKGSIEYLRKKIAKKDAKLRKKDMELEKLKARLGSILITTKENDSAKASDVLDILVMKVLSVPGFEKGIWEKKRYVSEDDEVGGIEFSFNYLVEDIMQCPGVKALMSVLRYDKNVENVKVDIID